MLFDFLSGEILKCGLVGQNSLHSVLHLVEQCMCAASIRRLFTLWHGGFNFQYIQVPKTVFMGSWL